MHEREVSSTSVQAARNKSYNQTIERISTFSPALPQPPLVPSTAETSTTKKKKQLHGARFCKRKEPDSVDAGLKHKNRKFYYLDRQSVIL